MITVFFILAFFLYLIFRPRSGTPGGMFGMEVKGGSVFVAIILFCALLALGERILYDLARFVDPKVYDYIDAYFNNFPTIVAHTLFAAVLLVISVSVNALVVEKRQKYATVLLPYFILSIIIALQVLAQIGTYFYHHHTQLQFYILMTCLVVLSSVVIHRIQRKYEPPMVP